MKFGKAKNPVERHLDGASKAKHTNGTSDSTASSTGINWGATPDDWHHFDRVLGLGGDLLPVVSNPDAPISPDSTMTALGKTPSRYDSRQRVIGIRDWPTMEISGQSLARWSREPDFGICIRTTSVRGLDVDITDPVVAQEVREFIQSELGLSLPCRSRGDSSKFLHPFRLEGEYGKRVIFCEGEGEGTDKIEWLMNGNQFVAVGTHPSGSRYEWEGGLPEAIPELTPEQFEGLFDRLQGRFGKREPTISGAPNRVNGADLDIDDPILTFMDGQGLVLGSNANGSLVVQCPWEHEHTQGETGDGSTVYYPAGVNGRESAGFKCLHGHCDGRKLPDYLEAIGYAAVATDDDLADGDDLPPVERPKAGFEPYAYDVTRLKAPEFVVDGFIRNGLTVIAGAPGVGKTSLLVPLAAAVAHLFDSDLNPVLRRKVAYFSEAPEQVETVLYGLAKCAPGVKPTEFGEWFKLYPSRRLPAEKLAKEIARVVRESTVEFNGYPVGPLIVLDTSNSNIDLENENDNSQVGKAIAALKQNLGTAGCWIVHHTPKAQKVAQAEELTARGASAFAGDANATVFVFAEDGVKDKRFMMLDKHRFEADFRELEFSTTVATETVPTPWGTEHAVSYRVGMPTASSREQRIAQREKVKEQRAEERTAERTSEINNRIFEYLEANGPSAPSKVEKGIGGNVPAVREAIEALIKSGALVANRNTGKGGGKLLAIGDLIRTELDEVPEVMPVGEAGEADLT